MAPTPSIYPQLKQNFTKTASGATVCSYTSDLGPDSTIMTLIHGYPQSAYIWRYLPGYGISTLCASHSKLAVGTALVEALCTVFSLPFKSNSDPRSHPPRRLLLAGHDRGARIAHRLAIPTSSSTPNGYGIPNTSIPPSLHLTSLALLDIIPTTSQWSAFAHPPNATAYFHWPFLANAGLATDMILAYGGGKFCRELLSRAQGPDAAGRASFAADGAWQVYCELFEKRETVEGSCADYAAGAGEDVTAQAEDNRAGRLVSVPTLVLYSGEGLGRRHDVEGIWREWIKEGVGMKGTAVEGAGHYLPEEAPRVVGEVLVKWVEENK